ncbi:MAG: GNAT family N-acetyltransferase [Verrucomicrobiales bacterium]|nr:GNAT family N-acetyltransferase [Verrucomicrobiales bacterium]
MPLPQPLIPGLRPATQADGPAIRNLVFSTLEEFGLQPDPAGTDADLFDLHQHYHAQGGVFFVIESDNQLHGCYGLHPTSRQDVELRKMYLRPQARGRGYGRALLQHALTQAREAGFQRVTLETAAVLTAAIRLYESHGFTRITPRHLAPRCDAAYELKLASPHGDSAP